MKAIVVGYDGSDAAKRALHRAVEFGGTGATLTVVSAVHILPAAGRRALSPLDPVEREERKEELEEARSILAERGIEARLVEGHGDPAEVIAQEAKETGADLIVVGTRGHGPIERTLLGSVSTKVLHHAPCDVLVVR
jgi:nucleotide-binding universal stress UspA family protein